MSFTGSRLHADNRSGNPLFDLCAHKLAQALYIADCITGRSDMLWYFRMTATNNAKKVGDNRIVEQQQEYLAEFLEEADDWWDSLESAGRTRIDLSFRNEYKRRISAALEVDSAGAAERFKRVKSNRDAGGTLGDNQGRSIGSRFQHPGLRGQTAAH